ncbi:Alsin, partial [Physocladia obscura]
MAEELTRLIVKSYDGGYFDQGPDVTITYSETKHEKHENSEQKRRHFNDSTPIVIIASTADTDLTKEQEISRAETSIETIFSESDPFSQPTPLLPARLFHGDGTAKFHSGHCYTGEFFKGFMHGNGVFTWSNGTVYTGSFQDNKITGVGSVFNGLRNGHGHFSSADGREYDGEWRDAKLHGYGTLVYNKSGTCFYQGQWMEGLKHGDGLMQYASGNVYTGEWQRNVKHGKGTMVWGNRHGETYDGNWENGLPHGFGAYIWPVSKSKSHQLPQHNVYRGQWMNGKRNGFGIFEYANGAKYEGEWKDNLKHGNGNCVFENGRSYIGEFRNDRPVSTVSDFQNDYPFVFSLDGLISRETNSHIIEETMKSINNVILRHTNELRNIYMQYSCSSEYIGKKQSIGTLEAKVDFNSHAMSRIQLWKFFSDCKIKEKGLSLVELDRAAVAHFKDDPLFSHLYKDPHNVSHRFIFYEFVDSILRISQLLYNSNARNNSKNNSILSSNSVSISSIDHDIAAAFSNMIKIDIIPNMKQVPNNEIIHNSDESEFREYLFKEMEILFSDRIYKLYTILSDSRPEHTVTIRMLLHFMNDAHMIDVQTGPLSIPKFIHFFEIHIPGVTSEIDTGSCNLEFELVPYEAFQSIFACLECKAAGMLHEHAYNAAMKAGTDAIVAAATAAATVEAERIEHDALASSMMLLNIESSNREGEGSISAPGDGGAGRDGKEKDDVHVDVATPAVAAASVGKKDKEKGLKKSIKDKDIQKEVVKEAKETREKELKEGVSGGQTFREVSKVTGPAASVAAADLSNHAVSMYIDPKQFINESSILEGVKPEVNVANEFSM